MLESSVSGGFRRGVLVAVYALKAPGGSDVIHLDITSKYTELCFTLLIISDGGRRAVGAGSIPAGTAARPPHNQGLL